MVREKSASIFGHIDRNWIEYLKSLFLRITLRIPTEHEFRVISVSTWARIYTQHIQNGGFC